MDTIVVVAPQSIHDVAEIFSPPRTRHRARARGFGGGWSLDDSGTWCWQGVGLDELDVPTATYRYEGQAHLGEVSEAGTRMVTGLAASSSGGQPVKVCFCTDHACTPRHELV